MSSSGDSKSGIFSWTTSRSSSQNSHRPLTPKQAPATDEVSEAIQPTAQSEASSRKFSHLDFIQLVRDGDIKGVRRTFDKCESMEEVEAYANAVGRRGQSALVVAIRNEYPNLARLLLKVGADPTFECDYPEPGTTPLRVAFETDRPNVQKMVCEAWTYQQLEAGVLTRMQDLRKFFKPEQASARVVAQRVLVKTYASCEPATFAHVVAPRFQVQPAQTLLDLLSLAAAMFRDSVRMEAIEPLMADTLRSGSVRLQLLAAGCLSMIGSVKDGLGRYECDELLRCPKGMDVLRVALQNGLKTFIAQPGTQSYVRREWSGPLLGRIADPDSTMPTGERLRLFCIFFVAFLCNALLAGVEAADREVSRSNAQKRAAQQAADGERTEREQRIAEEEGPAGRKTNKPVTTAIDHVADAASAVGDVVVAGGKIVAGLVGDVVGAGKANTAGGTTSLPGMEHMHDHHASEAPTAAPSDATPSGASRRRQQTRAELSLLERTQRRADSSGGRSTRSRGDVSWLDLYLLRTPAFKFAMRVLADIALATAVVFLSEPAAAASHGNYILLVWSIGGCITEYNIIAPDQRTLVYELQSFVFSDKPSIYRSNALNLLDFFTFHLLLAASLARLMSSEAVAVALLSGCGICTCLRLLRTLMLSSSLGPLVLMLINMVNDVLKLLILLFFVLTAVSSGLYILFNASSDDTNIDDLTVSSHCQELIALRGDVSQFEQIWFVLLNGAIRSEGYIECLMESHRVWTYLVWLYAFGFVLITAILMLNMLIAMMAKTFDTVWEAAEINYQFLFARLVISQHQRPSSPAPFNLLHIPTAAVHFTINLLNNLLVSRLLGERSCLARLLGRASAVLDAAFEYSPLLVRNSGSPWLQLNVVVDVDHNGERSESWGEYKGTETPWNHRNSWNAWRDSVGDDDLADGMLQFLEEHEDDQVGERWRSKIAQSVSGSARDIQMQLAQLAEQLDALPTRAAPKAAAPGAAAVQQEPTPSELLAAAEARKTIAGLAATRLKLKSTKSLTALEA